MCTCGRPDYISTVNCILFVSQAYATQVRPNLERISVQERALKEKQEYILPVRFDDTKIPGLPGTVAYIALCQMPSSALADCIREKIDNSVRRGCLPPVPDRLFELLHIEDDRDMQVIVQSIARSISCHTSPDNIHIHANLLRRSTDQSIPRLKRIWGGLNSHGVLSWMQPLTMGATREHAEALQ